MPHNRDRQRKYRGTVLVMVVGLLVMLFVMGTSFLFVSRFEKRMTEEMVAQSGGSGGGSGGGAGAGYSVAVLTDMLGVVRDQLRKDIVGTDGVPFNGGKDLDGDTGSVREDYWDTPGWFDVDLNSFSAKLVPSPAVGEVPHRRNGLQNDEIGDGLLAGNEPYPDPNNLALAQPLWTWFAVSSFADNNPRLSHQVVQYPDNAPGNPGSAFYWRLPWWPGTPNFNNNYGAASFRYDLFHTRPRSLETAGLVPDADGDGYPDSLFATRDREGDNNETAATAVPPPELWPDEKDWQSWSSSLDIDQKVALRVISHGGMVLLDRETPESLLIAATDRNASGSTQHIIWPANDEDLDPDIEEVNLRRRNCLPPPDDPHDPGGPNDKRTEFERRNNMWLETTDGATQRRWYPLVYDEAEANGGNDEADVWDQTYFQDPWMTPPTPGDANVKYDRRHLVTTISYDDLYRPNRNEAGMPFRLADGYFGGAYQEGILRRVGASSGFRFPYLPDEGLVPPDANGNLLAGRTQFSLADLDETGSVYTKAQQVRLLYAFYRALLHDTEVPVSLGGAAQGVNRSEQAAMLAVNTWDFFDSDLEPTVVGPNGDDVNVISLNRDGVVHTSLTDIVGIEPAFPFISEVIVERHFSYDIDGEEWELDRTDYALELFNPWPQDLRFTQASPFRLYVGTNAATVDLSRPLPHIILKKAKQTGHVNGALGNRNLLVIGSLLYEPKDEFFDFNATAVKDIRDGANNGTVVVLYARNNYTGQLFAIDEIDLDTSGSSAPDKISSKWPVPKVLDEPPGDTETLPRSLARTQSSQDPQPLPHDLNDWRFHLGIEQDVGPTPKTVNTATRAAGAFAKPVPLYFSNTGEPLGAFPSTGALLLVTRYGHAVRSGGLTHKPLSTFLAEPIPLSSSGSTPIDRPWRRVDHGHMPVFDQEQLAGINDDEGNAAITVPWGQLVFSYFTALPLQRLNLDGIPQDYDGNDGFNRAATTPRDYRMAYGNLLQRLTPANLDINVGLAVPLVERVAAAAGYAYGPRVRGRININTAPWSVLDGIPLVQYFNTYNVGPVTEIDLALDDILNLADSPLEAQGNTITIAPALARSMVAYREARQAYPGSANYTDRATLAGMAGRGAVGTLRKGPGFVTVGELANLVHGQVPGAYVVGDSAYRIDALPAANSVYDQYPYAIAILSSLPDWLTVKSNTYTVYATVVDSADEVEVTRGQWTVDRTRCLYQPAGSHAGLPEIIGPEVMVNYADAADDPR